MLRFELHIAFVLAVEGMTLGLSPRTYFLFFWVNSVKGFAQSSKNLRLNLDSNGLRQRKFLDCRSHARKLHDLIQSPFGRSWHSTFE
ncbi:hypothetical protein Tco_0872963 [Tanacetum coccineum]